MNPRIKRLLSLFLALTMVFSLTTPVSASAASTTAVGNNKVEIEVGETAKLKVSGVYSKTTWTSSDKEIATVSGNGTVTGVAPGTATITASSRNFFGFGIAKVTKYTVTVVEPEEETLTVKAGETLQLDVETSGGTVTWKSSDKRVATVNSKGLVTGVSEGDVTITATEKKVTGNPFFWWAGSVKTVVTTTDFKVTVLPGDNQPTEGTEPPESVPAKPVIPVIPILPPCPTEPEPTETEPPVVTYTVTFESNGGSAVEAQVVEEGMTATEPEAPVMEGYTFAGWYADAELTTAYDFATPVTADVVLYAAWEDTIIFYTVMFETNGGSAVSPQTVEEGATATYPGEPTYEGFVFAGWYLSNDEVDLTNQYDFNEVLTRDIVLYAKWIDINLDTDGDTIPDELESYFGSDPENADTDGDGLDDYEECIVLGTSPVLADSDENGVTDFDEDADADGLSNGTEFSIGTNPISPDTDFDGLTDGEEVNGTVYQTNPLLNDTDSDGADDAWEIANGFDPTTYNDSFDITVDATSVNVSASVSVNVPGEKAVSMVVEAIVDHPVLTQDIPGYIDVPFEFTIDDNLEGAVATISFVIGDDVARDENFVPAIYYYNDATQELEELVTQINGNVVSAEVAHFSTYILLNKTEFDVVWENEIKPPITSDGGNSANIDVVFVIDCSGSMSSYNRMSTAQAALHTFIDALSEKDRAALVKFTSSASVLSSLTTDKASVDALVDDLSASGQTAMYTGLEAGINLLSDSSETYGYKMIIVLSDGTDEPSTTYSGYYASLVDSAIANNIVVYTIGAGTSVNTSILTQVAENTGGAYYVATQTSGITDAFEEIQEDTVDLITDTDEDKIPDYYEQRLTTGGGVSLNLDINDPDCDDDGLLDGEEVVITESSSGKVYGVIKSDPHKANSDMDAYGDYAEVKTYGSDPMVKNVVFMHEDTDFLIENENYVSDKYLDFYENKWYGWLERAGVWLGNRVFAANYDDVYLYKVILMEYLEQMVEESEDAKDLLDALEFSHKLVSQMNTQVGEALELLAGDSEVNEANKQLLEKLTSQLDDYEVQLEEFRNMDLTNAGQTKEQVYAMWDDVFADYLEVSDQVPELKAEVEFNTKVSSAHNASEVFGVVMDVADVVLEGVDVVKNYVNFVSKLDEMEGCLDTLLLIQNSPDSPEDLKSAAKEVYNAIKDKKVDNFAALKDLAVQTGGKVFNIAAMKGVETLLAGVVAGKYIIAAKVILGIADFAFNLGDVAEQCSCLFAISKSSTILASDFDSTISEADVRTNWTIVYDDYTSAIEDYFALAIIRKKSENQMKKADEANSFLIEWLFTEFMYKVEDIDTNVKKLDGIKHNYILCAN